MKRSDAINKLKDEIKSIVELHKSGCLDIDNDAHLLLNLIEHDIGMLPPLQENIDMYTEPSPRDPADDKRD